LKTKDFANYISFFAQLKAAYLNHAQVSSWNQTVLGEHLYDVHTYM